MDTITFSIRNCLSDLNESEKNVPEAEQAWLVAVYISIHGGKPSFKDLLCYCDL